MRLGVNIVRLTRKFTGVGRYIECVLNEWSQVQLPFDEVVLYSHSPIPPSRVVFPLDKFRMEIIGTPAADPVWEWRTLRQVAKDVDVLFCPSYTIPIGYPGKCAVGYLGPSENKPGSLEWWRSQLYNQLYKYSARHADHVFACSQVVKRRVVEVFGVAPERVSVTFLAASSHFKPITDTARLSAVRQKYLGSDTPYILFVGKLARRHYIPNLLEAFAEIHCAQKTPHKLMIVGPDYLPLHVPERARALGIGEAVVYHPFVQHADLPPVYSAADIFIFPASEAEGFGIPPIEAMACGTPTITTNQGSLREFAPGAALLTETNSVDDLRTAMARLISDDRLKQELRIKGPARAREITWRITAEKTMNTLWQLANRV